MKQKNNTIYEIILLLIIIAAILIPQLVGTTTVNDETRGVDEDGYPATSLTNDDFKVPGMRFGTLSVTEWELSLSEVFPEGELRYYNTMANMYEGVANGEVDAALGFLNEREALAETHPDVAVIKEPFKIAHFGFGFTKSEKGAAICSEFNSFLKKIKEDGTYDAIKAKWEDPKSPGDMMGDYTFTGEKGTLKIATGGLWTPMTYYVGNTLTGEFIEITNAFCAEYGYTPVYEVVSFDAEITGLTAGTYDVMADSVVIFEERLELINISDPLMDDNYHLVVKKDIATTTVPRAPLFFENLKGSIRRTFITEDRYRMLLSGLGTTLALSLFAGVLGTLLGAVICFLRMRKNPFLSAFASLYIKIFRSLPVVVLLLVLNFIVFKNSGLTAFQICVVTFSVEFSAYCAEIFRSGINAVPEGQKRAATALGFSRLQVFKNVTWPQALVHSLPVYSGQFIATVKMTAVAGYISVIDLTKASDIIRARTYEAFFPLFFTSLVYILLCFVLVTLLRVLEKKTDPALRKPGKDIQDIVASYKASSSASIGEIKDAAEETEKKELLKIEHLRKSFGDVMPLKDINCSIYKGDAVSIIGPSGTGKSTLLNLINHLEEPDSGSIFFEGKDTLAKGYDYNRMRQHIGMVFQSFNLFSHLTVVENLMLAQTELLGRSREDACRKSLDLLHMVGMDDKALNLPSHLSGGQQQRVAIMRTVAMDPSIILFDEPTSALDPTMIGDVLAVIRNLARSGMTMLIVTHEMRFAKDVSNRVFYMDEGLIYEEGSPDEIFTAPKKDRTRQFIRRLKVLEYRTRKTEFDTMELITAIEHFGFHHMIGRKLTNKMLTVAEELFMQTILPSVDNDDEIKLVFEYNESGDGSIETELVYNGENSDPLKDDSLSVILARYALNDMTWEYKDGICTVSGTIN